MPADLSAARAALAAGDKPQARALLMPIARSEPGNGEAWYLLAQALDDAGQKQDCLNRATANGYPPESDYLPPVQAGVIPHVIRSPQPIPSPQIVVAPAPAKPTRPTGFRNALIATIILFGAFWYAQQTGMLSGLSLPSSGGSGNRASETTRRVDYEVGGTTGKAMLTYQNGNGSTQQDIVQVPWNKRIIVSSGDFLYISAQNQEDRGTITCEILVDGVRFKHASSTGGYVIASCDGSAP